MKSLLSTINKKGKKSLTGIRKVKKSKISDKNVNLDSETDKFYTSK